MQDYPNVDPEISDEVKGLKLLEINESFFGKDSHSTLVKQAMNIRLPITIWLHTSKANSTISLSPRNDSTGNEGKSKNSEFWEVHPVSAMIT